MKTYLLLFFLIFASCAVQKSNGNLFDTVANKEYVGIVVSVDVIKIPALDGGSFTLVQTDQVSIPVRGVVHIADSTACYLYQETHQGIEKTMLIWDGAKQAYELN